VSVDLVISLVEQLGVLFQVTVFSLKLEQAWADTVVADVPTTLYRYKLSNIEVGVIALGHGMALKSNSIKMLLCPDPELEVPRLRVCEVPMLLDTVEEISESGTPGKRSVSLNIEPR
jgi:hypothetical protein